MPRSAHVEIHGADGELLARVESRITGGGVSTELPVFPPGTLGTLTLVTEYADGEMRRQREELRPLPTSPIVWGIQMG